MNQIHLAMRIMATHGMLGPFNLDSGDWASYVEVVLHSKQHLSAIIPRIHGLTITYYVYIPARYVLNVIFR